jgi:hypothetical protein
MCTDIELKEEGTCASGFSAKALLDWLCQAHRECKDDYAAGKEAFGDNLPKLVRKGST